MTTLSELAREADGLRDSTIALRRELHACPELAFQEHQTAAYVAARMRALGLEVTEGLGGTGVVGVLTGGRPGKTLIFRAELDAVEMVETPGPDYRARVEGRNHCCGHDAGMAVALSSAELLSHHLDEIAGRVAFVFQPADEPMTGALPMIRDGLFGIARPDLVLGLHVLPAIKAGQVVVQPGPLWASRDEIKVSLSRAAAASGTAPAKPLPLAVAELVSRLHRKAESLVAGRELVHFAVASVRAEAARTNQPSTGFLQINFASHDISLREDLLAAVDAELQQWGSEEDTALEIEAAYAIPPLHNDATVAATVREVAAAEVGEENIVTGWRNPFADDVAFYTSVGAGCYVLLGTTNPDKGVTASWHTPEFDIDEDVLALGLRIIAGSVLKLLSAP